MKQGFYAIITTVAIITVFLVVLAYGSLETVTVPDSIISYKANHIVFDDVIAETAPSSSHMTFTHGSYTFVSDKTLGGIYAQGSMNEIGTVETKAWFTRYRSNVYDANSGVEYTEGVPVYCNVYIYERSDTTPSGEAVYTIDFDGYYLEFSFEQFAKNSTYTLDYQAFMRDNSPSLQRPPRPDYSADNTFQALKHFFNYIGDVFEHLLVKMQWLANYPTFYVQDYAVLFKL